VAILERRGPMGFDIKFLDAAHAPYSVGRSKDVDLVIDGDDSISSVHAELEIMGSAWCFSDLGSTNGTFVNGDRIITKRVVHDGDVIRLGRTTLTLRDGRCRADGTTKRTNMEPPEVTKTERLVLIELCRPVMSGQAFTPPASVETIAKALYVGSAAVRAHLGHLYDKFGIEDQEGVSKRVQLANAAIETGAVAPKDLE
jgi:pSer/pThr/pTyr-binding forkhead associated (FHA) protein